MTNTATAHPAARPAAHHAALLIGNGEHPKLVQERLGRHSAAFTLDVYGHLLPGAQRDAAERVGAPLDQGSPEPVADPVADGQ